MIEIRITEIGQRWVARITQQSEWARRQGQPARFLARVFATNVEAWQWAQRIVNNWQKEENPDDQGADRGAM